MGAAEDCGDALQASCLEGSVTLGLHQTIHCSLGDRDLCAQPEETVRFRPRGLCWVRFPTSGPILIKSIWVYCQLGRRPGLELGGWEFKSLYPDHFRDDYSKQLSAAKTLQASPVGGVSWVRLPA